MNDAEAGGRATLKRARAIAMPPMVVAGSIGAIGSIAASGKRGATY